MGYAHTMKTNRIAVYSLFILSLHKKKLLKDGEKKLHIRKGFL